MLIDGGPTSNELMYTTPTQARMKLNLFYTLNHLSGATLAVGTTPLENIIQKIDTLVLTHDDLDHKRGTWFSIDSAILYNKPPLLQQLIPYSPLCAIYLPNEQQLHHLHCLA